MQSKTIICHDMNGNEQEVDINKLKYRPSIYGILIESDKILLSKQWDGYDFPGGGANIDETVNEALKREFFEETGLKIEVLFPVYVGTSFFAPPSKFTNHKQEFWNCPLVYFVVKKIGGNLSIENCDEFEKDYMEAPEWIDLQDINKINFINSVDSVDIINKAVKMIKNIK